MKLLLTKKKPLYAKNEDFLEAFENYSSSAESVRISTGYVSVESLQYLLENAKAGALPYLELTIGMHHFDGFTRAQYDCAMNLAQYLEASNRGSASICVSFPYHGKVYSFHKAGKPFAAIVGSSNLSGLLGSRDAYNYEVDTVLEEPAILAELSDFQSDLKGKACKVFSEWEPKRFIENIAIPGAEKLAGKETADAWRAEKLEEFEIPLKTELKSNLNACFGKGRENRKKFVRPRPWYEVELIVPSQITAMPGFPRLSTFKVVTDDGWSFSCKTSGNYSKNFRSENDLCILGHWLKGRLESAGILRVGELVTPQMLESYGRSSLKLIKTEDPGVWLMDFCNKKS